MDINSNYPAQSLMSVSLPNATQFHNQNSSFQPVATSSGPCPPVQQQRPPFRHHTPMAGHPPPCLPYPPPPPPPPQNVMPQIRYSSPANGNASNAPTCNQITNNQQPRQHFQMTRPPDHGQQRMQSTPPPDCGVPPNQPVTFNGSQHNTPPRFRHTPPGQFRPPFPNQNSVRPMHGRFPAPPQQMNQSWGGLKESGSGDIRAQLNRFPPPCPSARGPVDGGHRFENAQEKSQPRFLSRSATNRPSRPPLSGNRGGGNNARGRNGPKSKSSGVKADKTTTPGAFRCEPCERDFKTSKDLTGHQRGHKQCEYAGCQFVASSKMQGLHYIREHETGKFRIRLFNKADVEKWRAERRKAYPTEANIAAKKEQMQAKREARIALKTKEFDYRQSQKAGVQQKHERKVDASTLEKKSVISSGEEKTISASTSIIPADEKALAVPPGEEIKEVKVKSEPLDGDSSLMETEVKEGHDDRNSQNDSGLEMLKSYIFIDSDEESEEESDEENGNEENSNPVPASDVPDTTVAPTSDTNSIEAQSETCLSETSEEVSPPASTISAHPIKKQSVVAEEFRIKSLELEEKRKLAEKAVASASEKEVEAKSKRKTAEDQAEKASQDAQNLTKQLEAAQQEAADAGSRSDTLRKVQEHAKAEATKAKQKLRALRQKVKEGVVVDEAAGKKAQEEKERATAHREQAEMAVQAARKMLEEAEQKLLDVQEVERNKVEAEKNVQEATKEKFKEIESAKTELASVREDIEGKENYAAAMVPVYKAEEESVRECNASAFALENRKYAVYGTEQMATQAVVKAIQEEIAMSTLVKSSKDDLEKIEEGQTLLVASYEEQMIDVVVDTCQQAEDQDEDKSTNTLSNGDTWDTNNNLDEQRKEDGELSSDDEVATVQEKEEHPNPVTESGKSTEEVTKPTAKRTRKPGKNERNNVKKAKLENNQQRPFVNKRVTLLEMLLSKEIRHERNVMLQCIRFIVNNNFIGVLPGD